MYNMVKEGAEGEILVVENSEMKHIFFQRTNPQKCTSGTLIAKHTCKCISQVELSSRRLIQYATAI